MTFGIVGLRHFKEMDDPLEELLGKAAELSGDQIKKVSGYIDGLIQVETSLKEKAK